eukprot:765942-Hanusia_phi.AAC.8
MHSSPSFPQFVLSGNMPQGLEGGKEEAREEEEQGEGAGRSGRKSIAESKQRAEGLGGTERFGGRKGQRIRYCLSRWKGMNEDFTGATARGCLKLPMISLIPIESSQARMHLFASNFQDP